MVSRYVSGVYRQNWRVRYSAASEADFHAAMNKDPRGGHHAVYADWLADRGQEHLANLVRSQAPGKAVATSADPAGWHTFGPLRDGAALVTLVQTPDLAKPGNLLRWWIRDEDKKAHAAKLAALESEGVQLSEASRNAVYWQLHHGRHYGPEQMARRDRPVLYAPPPWRTRGVGQGITHADLHRWLGKKQSRAVDRNKEVYRDGDDIVVRLHNTDVVRLHPDNTFTLRTGGWNTPTTRRTIGNVIGFPVRSVKGTPQIGDKELVEGMRWPELPQAPEVDWRPNETIPEDYYSFSRLTRGLKVRLSRAVQAHRSAVVRYKKCPRCGGSSRKTQSIMYRWRCKGCGLSHGRTKYAEDGGMPWVHGGKKGYARPVRYARGPSPAARILESHLREQGRPHAAAIVRGHYSDPDRYGLKPDAAVPGETPLSWMGPLIQHNVTHTSHDRTGTPNPLVAVTHGASVNGSPDHMLILYTYHGDPKDLGNMRVVSHYFRVEREHVPGWLRKLQHEGVSNADREYRLFTRKYGPHPFHDPELPPEFTPEENEVDWRPNEVIPEDFYPQGYSQPGHPHQYEAYRAPAGGAIARGVYYPGGKLMPDLRKFAPSRPASRPATPR